MSVHKNHAAGGENSSIMVGMFVFLCLASHEPYEREFFIPAVMDLGDKLLNNTKLTILTKIWVIRKILQPTRIEGF